MRTRGTSDGGPALDGRVRRGERTRAAIVDALLALLQSGELRPTARQIAERAGVSVRSIFQHFDDLEGLYSDVVREQSGRVQPLVDALSADGDLAARVDALTEQRARLYEAITPVRRAVGNRARHSPVVAARIRDLSDTLFDQVCRQFAAELGRDATASDGAGGPGADADHEALTLAVDALCSFETWDRLRDHHGLDVARAQDSLRRALLRLLTAR